MAERQGKWRRIEEDGAEWEARTVPGPEQLTPDLEGDQEILEFVCVDGTRKSRRVAVGAGELERMDGDELRRAYRRARPIAGDHYGRPGKPANDAA